MMQTEARGDKFEVIAGGNGPVDLGMAKHALDAVALLVERPVMLDLYASV